jgi:hypothetical protein
MKRLSKLGLLFGIVAMAGLAGLGSTLVKRKTHVLTEPMKVGLPGVSGEYALPKGTVLYYETSLSEGTQIFKVYVRLDGPMLPLVDEEHPNSIDPLHGANPLLPDRK